MASHAEHNVEVLSQFTQQAENYARLFGSMRPDRVDEFKAIIGPPAPHQALEIACGPGTAALDLAPFVEHVTGIDLTPAMIEQARAAQAERGVTNVSWMVGDAADLPFDDGAFSLVVCRAAFHHMIAPERVLREMARVCRSGGRIAVSDVSPAPDKAAAYNAVERMRDPSHIHAHPLAEFRALATGLPLAECNVLSRQGGGTPLDAVLATSFPVTHSIDEVRSVFARDAESGENRLGLNARTVEGKILVDYPMTTIVWTRD